MGRKGPGGRVRGEGHTSPACPSSAKPNCCQALIKPASRRWEEGQRTGEDCVPDTQGPSPPPGY